MAEAIADLGSIIFWGGKNDDKTSWGSFWNHDVVVCATYASKMKGLSDPEALIPVMLNAEMNVIKKKEVYEKVFEYSHGKVKVEVGPGREYTIYRIFGAVSYENIAHQLTAKGFTENKPDIHVVVPDRPPVLPDEEVYGPRLDYHKERQSLDSKKLSQYRLGRLARGLLTFLVFGGALGYLAYASLVLHYKDIELAPENYLGTKGEYVAFTVDERMILFKFDENVEEQNFDGTHAYAVDENKNVFDRDGKLNRRIVIDQVRDANDNEVYRRGNRIVEFNTKVPGYELVRATDFEFDSYKNRLKPDGDYANFYDPSRGLATPIVFTARPYEQEGLYWASMGHGSAKLGDVTDNEADRFYNQLADPVSYLTLKYAMENKKILNIFGQITNVFSTKEGRNSKDRKLFEFKVAYVRER